MKEQIKKVTIVLTYSEADLIYKSLLELPAKQVLHLLQNIDEQINEQIRNANINEG